MTIKILIFSDLHSSNSALNWLVKLLQKEKPNLVLSPGDIVNFHDQAASEYVKKFLANCRTQDLPLKVVFGNNEAPETIDLYDDLGISIHGKTYSFNNFTFVGVGDIESNPSRMFDIAKLPIQGNILLTHRPPDPNSKFQILNPKLANAPAIHIAGHLHSRGFSKKFGQTLVVNAPAASEGGAAILTLPDKKIEFVRQ